MPARGPGAAPRGCRRQPRRGNGAFAAGGGTGQYERCGRGGPGGSPFVDRHPGRTALITNRVINPVSTKPNGGVGKTRGLQGPGTTNNRLTNGRPFSKAPAAQAGTTNRNFHTVPNGTLRSERIRPAVPQGPFFDKGPDRLRKPPTTGALARSRRRNPFGREHTTPIVQTRGGASLRAMYSGHQRGV